MSDNFIDDVNQFQFTEVAIDYNAAFVGALAAIEKYYGNIVIPTPPATTPRLPPQRLP